MRALCHHEVADDFGGLGRTGAALLREPAVSRASLPGDEGLLVAEAHVPLTEARVRGHVALCVHRGGHGTRPREREADRSGPAVPVDDTTAGPRTR